MEFIIEILITVFVEFFFYYLIKTPGATILWFYHGRQKSLKNSIAESDFSSVLLGILFWMVIVGLILLAIN